ncbi:integrin alpha-8-like [Ostrea edulis]|uniref:integrin alpha-8-like n=1 Tax=Ostrea edulis TaxID=37623 RepID=UPI0024AFB2B3|nr:integrin alpha-8-like [Ostrea edulis]
MEIFLILYVLQCLCNLLTAYNVDIQKPLIYRGTANDQFGYTAEILTNHNKKQVLIGAPEKRYSEDKNVTGMLLSCPVQLQETETMSRHCGEIQPNMSLARRFASTIYKHGDSILACSPLRGHTLDSDITTGGCEVFFRNMSRQPSDKYLNIRGRIDENRKHHIRGMYGFSVTAESEDSSIILGGPNACGNDGGLAIFNGSSANYLYSGRDCSRLLGGYYFGYSLDTIDAEGTKMYVVGKPGFANKNGVIGLVEVVLNTKSQLQSKKQIPGLQAGGGFAQSLCVTDVNADGMDDIIVGAPLEYVNLTDQSSIEVDVGRVYVFLGSNEIIRDDGIPITGDNVFLSRFGTALAALGDINDDNYRDLAVGAPFENEMRGAVYIFNGCSTSCVKNWQYSQKILAGSIHVDLRGFGFYISRSQEDIDDNEYRDFAVGSYSSGMAVVLRSRPLVSIEPTIHFTQNPIPLNSSGLGCSAVNDLPCLEIQVCFNLTGRGVLSSTYINFSLVGDTMMTKPRILIDGDKNRLDVTDFRVNKSSSSCTDLEIHVEEAGIPFFNSINEPIVFMVNLSLSGKSSDLEVLPILRKESVTSHQNNVTFKTTCGRMEHCQPHFAGSISSLVNDDSGEYETFRMGIIVRNHGDPAVNTVIEISKEPEIEFSGFVIFQDTKQVSCNDSNPTTVLCDVTESPFFQHQLVNISIDFRINSQYDGARGFVDIRIGVRYVPSGQSITNRSDISQVRIERRSVVTVGGEPREDQKELDSTSKALLHKEKFHVYNSGPSAVDGLLLQISVPWAVDGVKLLNDINYNKDICKLKAPSQSTDPLAPSVDDDGILNINCSKPAVDCHVLECTLRKLMKKSSDVVDLHINITTNILNFLDRVRVVNYITSGRLLLSNNSTFEGRLQTINGEIILKIISKHIAFESSKIDLGVVIGGSIGGLVFLILLGLALKKVGFFERQKREQVDEYKRRTAIMKRQSRMSKMSKASRSGAA